MSVIKLGNRLILYRITSLTIYVNLKVNTLTLLILLIVGLTKSSTEIHTQVAVMSLHVTCFDIINCFMFIDA